MANVEIYTTASCSSCVRAKRFLAERGFADITEFDVSLDRSSMIERTSGRSTVPQIFIDDQHIGGYEDLIAYARAGNLVSPTGM